MKVLIYKNLRFILSKNVSRNICRKLVILAAPEQTYSALTVAFQLCTMKLNYLFSASLRNHLHIVKSQPLKWTMQWLFKIVCSCKTTLPSKCNVYVIFRRILVPSSQWVLAPRNHWSAFCHERLIFILYKWESHNGYSLISCICI